MMDDKVFPTATVFLNTSHSGDFYHAHNANAFPSAAVFINTSNAKLSSYSDYDSTLLEGGTMMPTPAG